MKEKLQEIQSTINNIFDYNIDTYKAYKSHVENALSLITSIPDSGNIMLQNWKTMAVDELKKELSGRLSDSFMLLSEDEQKSEFKFSKMAVSMILMNIIMYL